jgi:hypothetical protein
VGEGALKERKRLAAEGRGAWRDLVQELLDERDEEGP